MELRFNYFSLRVNFSFFAVLALMLLLMGGYGEDLERLIREESVIWQTLLRDKA